MSLQKIQDILYDSIGLDSNTIGTSAVLHAVNERINSCKLNDIESYYENLINNKGELAELIDEVIIPESWFFRDGEPFRMLTKFVNDEWLKSNPSGPLRVLSLPCATGEEPYSIAIALTEAGLTPSQIHIDAVDVSKRNINKCIQARYRKHSFRGVDPLMMNRFLHLSDEVYSPDVLTTIMVNFNQASILDPEYVHSQTPYDIVFCRNMFIYFDDKTQQNAINMLSHLVTQSGILFVGHSETAKFIDNQNWNISYKYPKSFAIRKFIDDARFEKTEPAKAIIKKFKPLSTCIKNTKPKLKQCTANKEPSNKIKLVTTTETPILLPDIKKAQRLADKGDFTKAKSICLDLLTINKQDSDAYFLLAFIQIATGDEGKAVEYFRNVIYLEPKNFDALMCLATLIGQQGDTEQAQRYRERAQRCQNHH